jgi:hypothetical protein
LFLEAMDLRDSLLDFEKNRAARTTVIDDQSDYFDSSAHWLTEQQQKEAAAKEKVQRAVLRPHTSLEGSYLRAV